jgi:hypothetical protein
VSTGKRITARAMSRSHLLILSSRVNGARQPATFAQTGINRMRTLDKSLVLFPVLGVLVINRASVAEAI